MPNDPASAPDPELLILGEFVEDARVLGAIRTADAPGPPGDRLRLARACELLQLTGLELVLVAGVEWERAAETLAQLASWVVVVGADAPGRVAGGGNVTVLQGEPRDGFADGAPYDAILAGGSAGFGATPKLYAQLTTGGRIVAASPDNDDVLLVQTRTATGFEVTTSPLITAGALALS
jgi:protein-L-isoaspartate O-methyltransferase